MTQHLPGEHVNLVIWQRIAQIHPGQETVNLSLRELVGALVLYGILGGHHEEGPGHRVGDSINCHLILLQAF